MTYEVRVPGVVFVCIVLALAWWPWTVATRRVGDALMRRAVIRSHSLRSYGGMEGVLTREHGRFYLGEGIDHRDYVVAGRWYRDLRPLVGSKVTVYGWYVPLPGGGVMTVEETPEPFPPGPYPLLSDLRGIFDEDDAAEGLT